MLSPFPRPAAYFAERIGLRGKASIRKLVERALAGNYISGEKQGGTWIVSRPGTDLTATGATEFACNNESVENGVVENGVAESDVTHSNLREPHRKKNTARTPTASRSQASESLDFCKSELVELRSADLTGALAPHLRTKSGLRGYFALLQKHGDFARTVILRKLGELSMALDGTDPNKITSWNYFEGAIEDELRLLRKSGHGHEPRDPAGRVGQ